MIKKLKRVLVLTFVLATGVALAGCGDKKDNKPKHEAKSIEDKKADKLTIKVAGKDVEVSVNPKKVVSLELSAIDTMGVLGVDDNLAGMPKATKVEYLSKYFDNTKVEDTGSLKEVDMEKINSIKPDLIILGARQAKQYDDYAKIAPTIIQKIDYKKGYFVSFKENVETLGKIFNKEAEASKIVKEFDTRIKALNEASKGKTALVTIASKNNLNVLGAQSRGSMISNEVGFKNLAQVNSSHGDNVSFEYIVEKNPNYVFVLDRDSAINAKGSKTAAELFDNELIKGIDASKNGHIVYLTPDVWYLAEGGATSTDIMLKDLEKGILKK